MDIGTKHIFITAYIIIKTYYLCIANLYKIKPIECKFYLIRKSIKYHFFIFNC